MCVCHLTQHESLLVSNQNRYNISYYIHDHIVASLPGPAQLSITCSTVHARGEPGNEASHIIWPVFLMLFCIPHTTCSIFLYTGALAEDLRM